MAQLPFRRPGPGESPLVIAHRGASAAAPENTIAAFELAIAQRADGVELDVQLSSDGVAVVVHDRTLRRTAGVRRRVSSLESSELSKLDCGSWFDPRFGRERVPSLADVLDLLRGRLFVNIEMKANRDAQLVDAVIAAVRATKTESEVLLSSFDHRLVLAARNAAPRLARATLVHPFDVGPASLAAKAVGASAIVVSRQLLKADRAADARAHRLALIVYTVDRRRDIERAVALGVDGIITNDPATTRNVLLGDRAGMPAD